jgi:hypothetical protein
MKKFKTLEQLIESARRTEVTGDEQAPFGFAARVVAQWRESRNQEPFYAIFSRLINPAVICSWMIAGAVLFYSWQSGSLPAGSGSISLLGGADESYYANEGEDVIWPQANG